MTRFRADAVMAGLTGFQQRTVEHVAEQFYGTPQSRRFLVADETGLGKSMVARGVIAQAIEKLQDDPTVERIDIVYVCSNADIAKQNLSKLDVLGDRHRDMPGRLTLLAGHSKALRANSELAGKPVNLVSFTPGTTFNTSGWQTGLSDERALLHLLMAQVFDYSKPEVRGALEVLRVTVGGNHADGWKRFQESVEHYQSSIDGELDVAIVDAFHADLRKTKLDQRFYELVQTVTVARKLPSDLVDTRRKIVGEMRAALSRAGVAVLDPDLVILDEFQRFRDLLDPTSAAGELAHELFTFKQAKVLLLSATPYKPFTYAEEDQDAHSRDFLGTLAFLAPDTDLPQQVAADLSDYRERAVTGRPVGDLPQRLRTRLLQVMSRQERPPLGDSTMLVEKVHPIDDVQPRDLLDFVHLQRLSAQLKAGVALDYWKSTPYFANYCDGYKLAELLRQRLKEEPAGAEADAVRRLSLIDRDALSATQHVDLGNAKLRALAADTVDKGWWKLLWMPPSLPYLQPQGQFANPAVQGMTKRLIFSSWTATPTAIATLLSHRADALLAEAQAAAGLGDLSTALPLPYRVENGRPGAMTTLALFWPMPGLADLADPLRAAAGRGAPVEAYDLEQVVTRQLRAGAEKWSQAPVAAAAAVALAREDSLPEGATPASVRQAALQGLGGGTDDPSAEEPDRATGLRLHVDALLAQVGSSEVEPASVAPTMAALAAHAPGNVAWRSLGRLCDGTTQITTLGRWRAAARLAAGLRALFNRPQTHRLLEVLDTKGAYWQKVLRYCAAGNLQAVLDEYLHHLSFVTSLDQRNDDWLWDLAGVAADAISLRTVNYSAFDPTAPDSPIRMNSRFALRYGGPRKTAETDQRLPEVRKSFNSPFWPFVLASTSVGQEGIDFHWWCSAIVHWNTPVNPVDFEQREGRVDRYAGHAVRRNLAARHSKDMLQDDNPWQAAFVLGEDERPNLGEFAPHWVYPGPARIERHLSPYPLSVDLERLQRLKTDVTLYRLTFGQPRQEDMLDLLAKRGVATDPVLMRDLRLDLSPPG